MKIVIKNENIGNLCYLQIKDLLKLSRIYNEKKFVQYYIRLINKGVCDNEFINITNTDYVELVMNCSDIVNFMEYKDLSSATISQEIIQLYTFLANSNRTDKDSKTDDLRDIIAFKKGELGYLMPLIYDGRLMIQDNRRNLMMGSTILKGFYVVKSLDNQDITELDYETFVRDNIKRVYDEENVDVEEDNFNYKTIYSNGSVIVVLNNKEKKQTFLNRIFSKIKRS